MLIAAPYTYYGGYGGGGLPGGVTGSGGSSALKATSARSPKSFLGTALRAHAAAVRFAKRKAATGPSIPGIAIAPLTFAPGTP